MIVQINERHHATVEYKSYQLIHQSQRYDEDVDSENNRRTKIGVQTKKQSFSGK